jgi:hypothetical protein
MPRSYLGQLSYPFARKTDSAPAAVRAPAAT